MDRIGQSAAKHRSKSVKVQRLSARSRGKRPEVYGASVVMMPRYSPVCIGNMQQPKGGLSLARSSEHAVRQFCDVRDASQQGKRKGDSFTWDVFSDVASGGGVLTETNTMPETNFTITQGTLTITEAGNSVPYSGKLDNLSKFPVMELIQKVLKNDAVKSFDRLAWTQFNQTLLRAIPTGGTSTNAVTLYTNGTVTGTNSIAFNNNHAKSIVDTMKERNIPWIGGIASANDSLYEAVA